MSRVWLGLDGGGSGTRCVAIDELGRPLARGCGPSSNRNHHSAADVRGAIRDAIDTCLGQIESPRVVRICAGVCGISTQAEKSEFTVWLIQALPSGEAPDVRVDNDAVISLLGGLEGRPGLVLISGTGSACYGRSETKDHWCGGWGALADDVGSGYWVALEALRAAVRMQDGRDDPTRLRQTVFDALGLAEPRDLLDRLHNHPLGREEFARFAPKVMDLAAEGDFAAMKICKRAASGLLELARTTRAALFPGKAELLLVGGLIENDTPVRKALVRRISREPTLTLANVRRPPEEYAAWVALHGEPASFDES